MIFFRTLPAVPDQLNHLYMRVESRQEEKMDLMRGTLSVLRDLLETNYMLV